MYKPFLGSNEKFDLDQLTYPLIVTIKKDGVHAIPRLGELRTRAIKSQELPLIKNKQIQEAAKCLKEFSTKYKFAINMEIYAHGLPLNELIMFVNTEDINTKTHHDKIRNQVSTLTQPFHYYTRLPSNLEFYIFDAVREGDEHLPYKDRLAAITRLGIMQCPRTTVVLPVMVNNKEELLVEYKNALDMGFEGLVMRRPDSPYKYGRSTFKEGYFLKLKPFEEFTGIIVQINERMLNFNESMESSEGYAVKSKAGNNVEGSGIAATATVMWEGKEVKVTLNGTESERVKIWNERESYIGKELVFSGMSYGSKDVPRFPRIVKINK
jgi:hypothetical protein